MSIIQQIREKYAAVGFGAIALSLIAFILMDAGTGGGGGGVTLNDAIGKVNGVNISYGEFQNKTRQAEQMYQMRGQVVDENSRQQIYADSWRSIVEEELLRQEQEKLGIEVTDKEFNDLLYGDNPPEDLKRAFTNPETGEYDVALAKRQFAQMKKSKGEQREQVEAFFAAVIENRKREKYYGLLQNSAYVPKWMVEKAIADNNAMASFDYVTVPYASIPDSTIKITDDQISKFVKAHEKEYRQEEATRSIAYVSFSYAPSAEDSANVYEALQNLKEDFKNADDPGAFVTRNSSSLPFFEGYNSREKIQIPQKDSIINAGEGSVYGPYLDEGSYVLSRVIEVKTLPDSVKARHILISMMDPQTQQPIMDDSTAKRKADSLLNLVKSGADFAMLAIQNSDDPGSKLQGGDLGYFSSGTMVKEFNDFVFDHKTGETGIVKTQFGYHIIQVTDQKNFGPAYKIAYMAKAIEPSPETINDAQSRANIFYGNSRSVKDFNENVAKEGLTKLVAPDIKESDYQITGLGVNRPAVKNIFEVDRGDVLEPEEFNEAFVVIAVTDAEKAGVFSAAKARPMVESILLKEEKGKKIIEKIGKPASLEAVAQAQGQTVQRADSVLFASPVIPGAGFEPKVGGYALYKPGLNKVSPAIAGNGGVFVIKPDLIDARVDAGTNVEEMQQTMSNQQKTSATYNSLEGLRNAATIKDRRSKFI